MEDFIKMNGNRKERTEAEGEWEWMNKSGLFHIMKGKQQQQVVLKLKGT